MTSSLWSIIEKKHTKQTDKNPSPTHPRFLSGNFIKRVSLFTFCKRRIKASVTVEAAFVLPLFLFFFVNLSSAVEMMRIHGRLQLALWEVGSRLSVYGCALERDADTSLGDIVAGMAFSYGYIRSEMVKYAGEDTLNESPLTYGADGLQFLESELFGSGDTFEVNVTYAVTPLTGLAGFRSFRMANRYYGHIWNGYGIPGGELLQPGDRDTVYLTESGKVYHESRECRHLKVSVREVDADAVTSCRNENGEKYTLCTKCRDAEKGELLYITREGNRFHYEQGCPGLKRTIYSVLRVTVKDYPACKSCGTGTPA